MKQKIENKKEKNDIIPKTLNWSTPHCDLLTKNKKLVNTNNGVTHLKRKRDNNEEEKITRIHVNLKYKNTNILKIIIQIVATIISSDITIIDMDKSIDGKKIDIIPSIVIEEILSYVLLC